jgi:hypothetical protein
MNSSSIVFHGLLRLDDVFKHGLYLVDCVVAALYLELLHHELFCFVGYTRFVQESVS